MKFLDACDSAMQFPEGKRVFLHVIIMQGVTPRKLGK